MKNIYFLSDAHLGCRALSHQRTLERRLVRFLDTIKDKAEAVYLLGDMFDFWFEYTDVVPKGFTRFLGKLSDLTDNGVEVHFFVGNHDMWVGDYLQKECGIIIHHEPYTAELCGQVFLIAHGHLIEAKDSSLAERMMMWCFRNKFLQRMARMIHPHWFISFGYRWARHSHINHHNKETNVPKGGSEEKLVAFAKQYLQTHPDINYFMFGHRHIDLDQQIAPDTRVLVLGQWYSLFTYAVFNGTTLTTHHYIEGETQL